MEFVGASLAGAMRIYVYIFLDKSGQTSVDIHYFIATALFRMIFLPALAGVCILKVLRKGREGIGAR